MKILLIILLIHFIGCWIYSLKAIWLICTREIFLISMRNIIFQTFLWELCLFVGIFAEKIGARFLGWKVTDWEKRERSLFQFDP